MSSEADAPDQFWFNTRSRTVERGRRSSWENLMGPYPTAQEAAAALDIARARNELWDDDGEWGDSEDRR